MIKEHLNTKLEIEIEKEYINEIIYKIFVNYIENENLLIKYNTKFDLFKRNYVEEINIHKQKILSNLSGNIFTNSFTMYNNIYRSILYIFTLGASYERFSEIDVANPFENIENIYFNIFNNQKKKKHGYNILAKKIKQNEILKKEITIYGDKIEFNNDLLDIVNLTNTTRQLDGSLLTEMKITEKIDLNSIKFKENQNLLYKIFEFLRKDASYRIEDYKMDIENVSLNDLKYNPVDELKICAWMKDIKIKINSTINEIEKKQNLMSLIFNSVIFILEEYLNNFRNLTKDSKIAFDIRSDYFTSMWNMELLKSQFVNEKASYTINYSDVDISRLKEYWRIIDDTIQKKEEISNHSPIIKENTQKIREILFSSKQKKELLKNTTLKNLFITDYKTRLLKNIAFRIKLLYLCCYNTESLFDIFFKLPEYIFSGVLTEEILQSFDDLYNDFSSQNLVTKNNIKIEIIDWIRTNPSLLNITIPDFHDKKLYFSMSLDLDKNYEFNKSFFLQEKELSLIEKQFNNIDLYTFIKLMNYLKPDPSNLINEFITEMKDIIFVLGNKSLENIRNEYKKLVCNNDHNCHIQDNNLDIEKKYSKIEVKTNEIIEKLYLSAYKFLILENSFENSQKIYEFPYSTICSTISAVLCHLNLKINNHHLLSNRDKILIIMFYLYKLEKIKLQETKSISVFRPQIFFDFKERKNELTGFSSDFINNLLKIIKGFIFVYFFDMTTSPITLDSTFIETFLGVNEIEIKNMDNNDLKDHADSVDSITFNYDKFLSNNLINLFFVDEYYDTYSNRPDTVYFLQDIENSEKIIKIGDNVRIINGINKGTYGTIINILVAKDTTKDSEEILTYMLEEYSSKGSPKVHYVRKDDLELEPMYKTVPYFFEDDYEYLFEIIFLTQTQTKNISENIEKLQKNIQMLTTIYHIIDKSDETKLNNIFLKETLNDIPFKLRPKIIKKYTDYKENIHEIKINIKYEKTTLQEKLIFLKKNEHEINKISNDIDHLFSIKEKWTYEDEKKIKEIFEYFYGKKIYDGIWVMTEESWGFEEENSKIEINLKKTNDIRLLDELLTKAGVFKNSGHYLYIKYLNPGEINKSR